MLTTTATWISAIVAIAGMIAGGFKLWQGWQRRKTISDERAAGAAIVIAEQNKEAAQAERRAAEASTNATTGANLDDDLSSGRKQF